MDILQSAIVVAGLVLTLVIIWYYHRKALKSAENATANNIEFYHWRVIVRLTGVDGLSQVYYVYGKPQHVKNKDGTNSIRIESILFKYAKTEDGRFIKNLEKLRFGPMLMFHHSLVTARR